MSIESITVSTTNYNVTINETVPITLEVTEGLSLDVTLAPIGLQGPPGPAGTGGSGDMEKSTYDTNDNGIVDAAESVPWSGVTGKPSTFTPSAHTHVINDVTGLQAVLDGKEPADTTILKDADIGVSVQAYDADLVAWAGISTSSKVNTTDGTANNLTITSTKEVHSSIPANNINLSLGNVFSKTISSSITFTVSNVPTTDTVISFILELTNGGSSTITWWPGMKWTGGSAPTLTASGVDLLGFYTRDAGNTWRGMVLSKDNK
jgi:hypothetical protein